MGSSKLNIFLLETFERRVLLSFPGNWGPTALLINQDEAASVFPAITGAGVSVAIIDSGINYTLDALGGGFGKGKKVVAGYDFIDHDDDPMDEDGHGTEVAGVIASAPFELKGFHYSGIAPGANLVALRVTQGDAGASDTHIEQALRWVIDHHTDYAIRVVNISLGSGNYGADQTNSQLSDELKKLADLDIAVFAASGNSGDTIEGSMGIAYPAADPSVYSVGSVTANNVISDFTQRAKNLDLLAPGEDVPTTLRTGGFGSVNGTSFSSPFAAGAAALLAQVSPGISARSLVSALRASGPSNRDGDAEVGRVSHINFPRLDLYQAINLVNARKTSRTNTVGGNSAASDIAYDSEGILHLAYFDAQIDSIRYATRDVTGRWSRTQIVDTSDAQVGVQLSIAVDSTGKPGIAYFDNTNSDLKYAHFDGSSWIVETRDANKSVGQSPSLTYNRYGDPVIAYYRKSGGDLKVQTLDAGANWVKYDVDSEDDVGEWASASVAQDADVIAVAYGDKTNGDLKYARFADGAWTIFTVDDLPGGAAYVDLNIHNNQAFIAYQDLQNGDLKFAKRENSAFQTEVVYTPGLTGQFANLIFDSKNNAHIAFYSKSKNFVYEATGSFGSWRVSKAANGGSWLAAAATQSGDALSFVSLDPAKRNLQFGSLEIA
ncbi:hypothetical protein BH09PLA1_BH09PLA1_37860 [soil metagenome]